LQRGLPAAYLTKIDRSKSIKGGIMEIQRKIGVIRSWNEPRGFGIVRIGPPSSLEKYFLHVSQIRTGTGSPTVGMVVHFEVSIKPVREGDLPAAINADVDVAPLAVEGVQS
jgi:cold shock CspA family protein